jgi:hypothetical protein
MSNDNQIVSWAIQLTGYAGALQRCKQIFTDPGAALIESEKGEGEDEEFSLRSRRFDGLTSGEILGVAADLVDTLNNIVARFGGATPIRLGVAMAIFSDGTRAKPVVVDTPVSIEIVTRPGMIPLNEADKTQVLQWFKLAENDDNVADALRFLNRGTWPDIYFAYEVMKCAYGGEHKLLATPWAKQHELSLVKQNANHYRHAPYIATPAVPITSGRAYSARKVYSSLAQRNAIASPEGGFVDRGGDDPGSEVDFVAAEGWDLLFLDRRPAPEEGVGVPIVMLTP